MYRFLGIAGAMLLGLLFLVPAVFAADPAAGNQRLIITSGADITLPADQSVDVFVVANGHARIEGTARSIFVFNGTADLVGAQADGIVAIQSQVNIDAESTVTGDIRTADSVVSTAQGATVSGQTRDFGPDVALTWAGIGSVLFLIYLAFAISAIAAGLVLAGVAARQVRAAGRLISTEPLLVIVAAFLGLIALIVVGVIAIITVVGIPFGIGLLALVLPGLFLAGYLVAGIWLGDVILARTSPGVERRRPYLAALIGLAIVGLLSLIPSIGGLISFVGLGAVLLLMWRVVRGAHAGASADRDVTRAAEAAG